MGRAVSVPFALLYSENRVLRAICCRLSCCSYVVTRIRILPRSGASFLPRSRKIPVQDVLLRLVPLGVIALRDGDGTVSQRTADLADVHPGLEQLHGERM